MGPVGWLIPTGDPGVHGLMLSRAEMAQRSSTRAASYMAGWAERGGESGEPESLDYFFYLFQYIFFYYRAYQA